MRTELSERDQARQATGGRAARGSTVRGSAARGSAARGSAARGSAARGSAARGSAVRGSAARRESRPRAVPEPIQGRSSGAGTLTRPRPTAEPRTKAEPRRRPEPRAEASRTKAEPRPKTEPRRKAEPRLKAGPRITTEPRLKARPRITTQPRTRPAPRLRPDPEVRSQRTGGRGLGGSRTPFVLLVLGLLGGGLICLLVINTTLATASFHLSNLQQGNASLSQQEQVLQQQIARDESPATIERRAYRLGLRQQQQLNFLNAATGRLELAPRTLPADIPIVPGFTP